MVKDDRLAFVYGEKAAQQGQALSQYNTGVCYYRGQGCEQSSERAADWYEKATRQGIAEAMYLLGCALYRDGEGRNQSFEQAAKWFEQAARRSNLQLASAQLSLGALLVNGQGVPKNLPRALELFKQSAAQGNTMALISLGFCHEFGQGVAQNYQEARRFYTLASAEGVDHLNRLAEKVRGKQVVITGTSREDLNGRMGTFIFGYFIHI